MSVIEPALGSKNTTTPDACPSAKHVVPGGESHTHGCSLTPADSQPDLRLSQPPVRPDGGPGFDRRDGYVAGRTGEMRAAGSGGFRRRGELARAGAA